MSKRYRCKECGKEYDSIGYIHAHAETHRGYTRFKIQIPFTKTSVADVKELDKYVEKIG